MWYCWEKTRANIYPALWTLIIGIEKKKTCWVNPENLNVDKIHGTVNCWKSSLSGLQHAGAQRLVRENVQGAPSALGHRRAGAVMYISLFLVTNSSEKLVLFFIYLYLVTVYFHHFALVSGIQGRTEPHYMRLTLPLVSK